MSPEIKEGILVGAIIGFAPGASVLLSLAIDFLADIPGTLQLRRFLKTNNLSVDQGDLVRGTLDNFCYRLSEYLDRKRPVDRSIGLRIGAVLPPKVLRKKINSGSDKTWEWFGENC